MKIKRKTLCCFWSKGMCGSAQGRRYGPFYCPLERALAEANSRVCTHATKRRRILRLVR